MTWVKLTQGKRIEVQGKMRRYVAGDWVDVGKQLANLWIGRGEAEAITFNAGEFAKVGEAGVLVVDHYDVGKQVLAKLEGGVAVECGEPRLPWEKTLIWNPEVALPKRWLTTGMLLLDTFDVAVPLLPYEKLASTLGTPEERERTRAVIRDLRVPVYNPAFLFVKRNETTEFLMACWEEERVDGANRVLSLLRAMYRAKPKALPLPCTWTDDRAEFDDGS